MKTFKEMILEGLTYTVDLESFNKIFKDNDYKRMSKGGKHEKVKLYGDGKEILFNYNEEKKQLSVLKQGWQLMNIKRGY